MRDSHVSLRLTGDDYDMLHAAARMKKTSASALLRGFVRMAPVLAMLVEPDEEDGRSTLAKRDRGATSVEAQRAAVA